MGIREALANRRSDMDAAAEPAPAAKRPQQETGAEALKGDT